MALNPEDPSGGFQHDTVMAFINEKMARHVKGPEFYLENTSLSWAEVEDKLRGILEDSELPSEAKEACAWGCLALGLRFAHKQRQLHTCRVQWLHNFCKLHKSAAQTLASNLRELTEQKEMERKEAAYHLRLTQAKLEEVQKERDLLRWKLFRAELEFAREQERVEEGPGLATVSGAGTERAGAPTPSAPAAAFTAGAPSQMSPHGGPSDVRPRFDVGPQGKVPEEPQGGRDADPKQQRPPVFRKPGDWDCPWCKAVNFSRREICFCCGGGIWLQKP
ncbi:testis-expressed protein 13B [Rhinolophus ferrumequinum]|uniref:testis-expressed protein 13B n=1 Tax=Rhinolophus ferrumequinum TaxID=59479 RepID=UPI00140FE0B0|nr:testis-expressed protein 13B [Rhinolophus ferrumequinum]